MRLKKIGGLLLAFLAIFFISFKVNAEDITKNTYTASIGDKGYDSLKEAIENAKDGDTVTLNKKSGVSAIWINKSIHIVLNADIISLNSISTFTVTNNANVTITGKGKIKIYRNDSSFSWGIINNGNVTIDGPTLYAYGHITLILNLNTLTINSGNFENKYSMQDLIINGYESKKASLIINGGTFIGTNNIYNAKDSTVVINNGLFTRRSTLRINDIKGITINGGTFTNGIIIYDNNYNKVDPNTLIAKDKIQYKAEDGSTKIITPIEKYTVKKVEENDLDNNIINSIKNNHTVAGYYDITYGEYTPENTLIQEESPNKEITVTLNIPANIPKVKTGYKRIYSVIRVHDNKVEELKTINNGNGTLTVKSDKFSIYAITYNDIKEPNNNNQNNTNKTKTYTKENINTNNATKENTKSNEHISNPQTGDEILYFVLVAIISLTGILIGVATLKRFN